MNASIITCSCNRARQLAVTLEALKQAHRPDGLNLEVIVVDNGSTDHTKALVQSLSIPNVEVKYAFEPGPGSGYARNRGLSHATGEIILFLDDDVCVPANWIREMSAPILDGRADAVSGAVKIAPDLERPWMDRTLRGFLSETGGTLAGRLNFPVGANFSFARKVLERVPAFDPDLGAGSSRGAWEDVLFGRQLRAAGYQWTALFENPVVHHFDPKRLLRESFIRRARAEGRSQAYVTYHWLHEEVRWPLLRAIGRFARVSMAGLTRRKEWPHAEGMSPREMRLRVKLQFDLGILHERRSPRRYARHGLTRLNPR